MLQVGVLHRRVSAVDRERIRRAKAEHGTARQYVDSAGRKRCVGIKKGLKKSQAYTEAMNEFLVCASAYMLHTADQFACT